MRACECHRMLSGSGTRLRAHQPDSSIETAGTNLAVVIATCRASHARPDLRRNMSPTESLTAQLERLAAFEPAPYPVISLYLNTQPGQHGRDQYQAFIRKEFKARSRTYPQNSPDRESLDRDLERISR